MPMLPLDHLHPPSRSRIHYNLAPLLLLLDLGIYLLPHHLRVLEGNIGNLVSVDFLDDKLNYSMI